MAPIHACPCAPQGICPYMCCAEVAERTQVGGDLAERTQVGGDLSDSTHTIRQEPMSRGEEINMGINKLKKMANTYGPLNLSIIVDDICNMLREEHKKLGKALALLPDGAQAKLEAQRDSIRSLQAASENASARYTSMVAVYEARIRELSEELGQYPPSKSMKLLEEENTKLRTDAKVFKAELKVVEKRSNRRKLLLQRVQKVSDAASELT